MKTTKPLATGFSIFFLVLLLLSLGGRFWASNQATDMIGPTHLAADSTQIFAVAADRIYHLSTSGELTAIVELQPLGLSDIPIDMRLLDDGRLLLASQRPAVIQICETAAWQCVELGAAIPGRPKRQFKTVFGADQSVLFLTDASGNNLWRWNLETSRSDQLLAEKILLGPNDLSFDSNGNLWVADTDHRRIVELTPLPSGDWVTGRSHTAMNNLTLGKRFYPMMLTLGQDGNWWVTQASEFSDGRADLMVYDPDVGAY